MSSPPVLLSSIDHRKEVTHPPTHTLCQDATVFNPNTPSLHRKSHTSGQKSAQTYVDGSGYYTAYTAHKPNRNDMTIIPPTEPASIRVEAMTSFM